ncbi:hypothetical protein OCU04_009536 [Sclerotinia nivalis]|uniref:Uncharacterized protein n=1 Tax=Sclerotinia nivalis TaxID=352851 RepID=A0A9X0AF93_9HELO|nr:hypothetical protein OCU04_009536 [Sclerotinia nivalis]
MEYPFFEGGGGSEARSIILSNSLRPADELLNIPPSDERIAGKAITILQLDYRRLPRSKKPLRRIILQHVLENRVLRILMEEVEFRDFVLETGDIAMDLLDAQLQCPNAALELKRE